MTVPIPEPRYDPQNVPRIKNAKRLAATRTKQLVRAASRAHDDPPPKPGLGECCGSSCDPCVNDLWREELACWKERWGVDLSSKGEEEEEGGGPKGKGSGNGVKEMVRKMPGSFEW